jgi:hypothetical protein
MSYIRPQCFRSRRAHGPWAFSVACLRRPSRGCERRIGPVVDDQGNRAESREKPKFGVASRLVSRSTGSLGFSAYLLENYAWRCRALPMSGQPAILCVSPFSDTIV